MVSPPRKRDVVRTGEIVAGKFRVERVLGEGGMGVVVAATHLQLRKPVALKFLRGDLRFNSQVVARFANEARAAAKLKSEHVAHVLDVGEHDGGVPFMVLEHLTGRDLGQVVSESGLIPIASAVEYVIQACDGVAEAHARGIVHRDIKPENLFLVDQDGWQCVKILDFGISKAAIGAADDTPSPESARGPATILGSPCYMSPEQIAMDEAVDHRADIWALGAVLFELLTGVTPFDASLSLHALMLSILHDPPRGIERLRPDVPRELVDVVYKCLVKDRKERYQTAAELAIALLPFAPRRARVPAERALSITKAAGLVDDDLAFPASIFPSGHSTPNVPAGLGSDESLPALVLKPAPVPRFDDPTRRTSMPTVLAPRSDSSLPPSDVTDALRARSRNSTFIAAACSVIAVVAAAFAIRGAAKSEVNGASLAAPAPTVANVATSVSPASPKGPLFAQLRVESSPQGASVRENGVELCASTPCLVTFQGEGAQKGAAHHFVIGHTGFATGNVDVAAGDESASVTLKRAATSAPPSRAKDDAKPPTSSPDARTPAESTAPPAVDGFKDLPY